MHKEHILGIHVSKYMESLLEEDEEVNGDDVRSLTYDAIKSEEELHCSLHFPTHFPLSSQAYKKQFSQFVKNGITADGVEAMYRNAHAAIRADPARAEKPAKDIKVRELFCCA